MNRVLLWWVDGVVRRAGLTLIAIAVLTAASGWIAVSQFRINSDLGQLINQDASWRADFDHFEAQFPDLVRTAVVVVSADSIKKVEQVTQQVLAYLHERPQQFSAVSAPGSEAFFRDHAFLYMDLDSLDDMTDRLAEAQPWLSAVAEDPSLRGILRLVGEGVDQSAPAGFATVLELLSDSAREVLAGGRGEVQWSDELLQTQGTTYQLIYLKPNSSFGEPLPDAKIMSELRSMFATLDLPAGAAVNLTGELALQHEEMEAAVTGVGLAGWLALVLLLVVLIFGVRSLKIILATFSLLAIGVLWTSAYAMLTVGEYNTLSLVFVVMFFGLAVDFALHFSLRYQEAINSAQTDVPAALHVSTESVGRAITLCTLTTALGFLGFWPTDYQGLADLGVISAGGMLVAWFLTFTYLPAFYAVCGAPKVHMMNLPTSDRVVTWLLGHRSTVVIAVCLAVVLAGYGAIQTRFDYSVLALKDPQAESMQTLRTLQREGLSTDYQLVLVGPATADLKEIEQLAVVDEVRTPLDWVPEDQQEKLLVITDIEQLLFTALNPSVALPPPSADELRMRAKDVVSRIDDILIEDQPGQVLPLDVLKVFRDQLRAMSLATDQQWRRWRYAVVDNLLEELRWIGRATSVTEVDFAGLPQSLRSRLVAPDGEVMTVILPAQDIAQVSELSTFITQVRTLAPTATGRPVIEWGVGGIVVTAFLEALVFAIVAIVIVLLIALRRVSLILMILLPLGLAAGLSLSLAGVMGLSLNMANILVIPLIFGLGVDNGIHVVDRYLGEGDVGHLIQSSTPRAVLLSALTTIGAFAALSISPHAGTASIGALLTIAIGLLLLITIFVLPVLLASQRSIR